MFFRAFYAERHFDVKLKTICYDEKKVWICWAVITACVCWGCSGKGELLDMEELALTNEYVLQKYLEAGFSVDSNAVATGEDTYATPEEALKALEEWKIFKESLASEKQTKSRKVVRLKTERAYTGDLLCSFTYRQLAVYFIAIHGNWNEIATEAFEVHFLGSVLAEKRFRILEYTDRYLSFQVHAEYTAAIEIGGVVVKQEHISVALHCTVVNNFRDVFIADYSEK